MIHYNKNAIIFLLATFVTLQLQSKKSGYSDGLLSRDLGYNISRNEKLDTAETIKYIFEQMQAVEQDSKMDGKSKQEIKAVLNSALSEIKADMGLDYKGMVQHAIAKGIAGNSKIAVKDPAAALLVRVCEPLGEKTQNISLSTWDTITAMLWKQLEPLCRKLGVIPPISKKDINLLSGSAKNVFEIVQEVQKAGDESFAKARALNIRKGQNFFDDENEDGSTLINNEKPSQQALMMDFLDYPVKNSLVDSVQEMESVCLAYQRKIKGKNYPYVLSKLKFIERRIKELGIIFIESESINDLSKNGRFQQIKALCNSIKKYCDDITTLLYQEDKSTTKSKGYSSYGYGSGLRDDFDY